MPGNTNWFGGDRDGSSTASDKCLTYRNAAAACASSVRLSSTERLQMFKTLLVPQFGQDDDQKTLQLASEILIGEGGHLNCLYVHDDAAAVAGCMQTDAMGVPVVTPQLINLLNEEASAQKKRAKQTFDRFCEKHGIAVQLLPGVTDALSASWHEISADIVGSVTQAARYNDAVVLKRGPKFSDPSLAGIGTIAIGSGRAAFLFPEHWQPRPIRCAVIAWKDAPEAARAVSLAVPVLKQAQRVFLFSASEDDKLESAGKSANACATFLRWHGIDPKIRCMESDEEDAKALIFTEAAGIAADVIVMGAYGHSRLREFTFGGFTRRALAESAIPLMLVH
jgi:nucleotide-binding universal stress UspA family protein